MKLSLNNLVFGYSRRRPVINITELTIERFPLAVLGPNGSGKSTFLSLLAGRYTHVRGQVAFDRDNTGPEHKAQDLRKLTSWVQQDTRALRGFSVRKQVAYSGWLKGMSYQQAWQDAPAALASVGLEGSERTAVHKLSGGQRRRLGIASAIVNRPEVLLLDEPYAGLDPEQRGVLRDTLRTLRETTALIVSTHQTEDLDDIYASTVVIDKGQLRFAGSTKEFLAHASDSLPRSEQAESAYRRVMQGMSAESSA